MWLFLHANCFELNDSIREIIDHVDIEACV